MVKKSINYMIRTPLVTFLFVVLFIISTLFLVCGVNIWAGNQQTMKEYENVFTTIGVVTQKVDQVSPAESWDAQAGKYIQVKMRKIDNLMDTSVLDMPGVEYIHAPKHRPHYGAWCPDYQLKDDNEYDERNMVIEASPREDCIPDHPIDLRVKRMLYGYEILDGLEIMFIDWNNEHPGKLYADKTYMMCVSQAYGTFEGFPAGMVIFTPDSCMSSTQYIEGEEYKMSADEPDEPYYEEVGPDFYKSGKSERWTELAKAWEHQHDTLYVTPVDGTQLLMPFHSGKSYVSQGKDISPEQYQSGERVCLVSETFAKRNSLSVGDQIRLPLYYSNYAVPAAQGGYGFGLLNRQNKAYHVFSDHEYTISGFYQSVTSPLTEQSMNINEVVIPAASVTESDKDNIAVYGRMRDGNTTFQIPNGSIESFMKEWKKQEVSEQLDITFHDKGYSELKKGIDNMNRMSLLFLFIGTVMTIVLIFFFCHVFITRQQMRTAIERLLGMTTRQCLISLLAGFLTFAALSITLGTVSGCAASNILEKKSHKPSPYDLTYSNMPQNDPTNIEITRSAAPLTYPIAAGAAVLILTATTAYLMAKRNLTAEPLELLAKKQE